MYTKTIVNVLLLSLALVHGIAISKPTDQSESPSITNVVSANPNNGFVVQSGYEGYIASPQTKAVSTTSSNKLAWFLPTLMKLKFVKSLLLPISGALAVYGTKILATGLHVVLATILGVAVTTAVCTFTPLCSISLNLAGIDFSNGQSIKTQVSELARTYMTSENMEMATQLLQSALNKYGSNQRREAEQPNEQENETTANK